MPTDARSIGAARPLRIGLSGAPGVGKTTLARALGEALEIPVLPEEMRAHLERTGRPLTGLPRGEVARVLHQLWRERAARERATPSFIADNSCLDFAAYAVFYDCLAEPAPGEPDEPELLREPRAHLASYDAIVVLPCGVLPYVRDGVRPQGRSAQLRHHLIIDGMLRRWADPRKLHHLPETCVTLADRVAWARAVVAPAARCGTVYLVGAGPGDPGLVTVRARALLGAADVVAHDALVPPAILALAHPGAELLPVGRRHGAGPTSYRLHPAVIARARAGQSVVRLKAGDPLVFGRGAEEAEELRAAGIRFEIVPGISAALGAAAYAGIPLTHRDHASDVTFATGHDAGASHASRTDWPRAAGGSGTLVLFMAARALAANLARVIALGRPPSTPAAYIAWATTPQQQVITGTLDTLAARAAAADPQAPALVIIGDVVAVRDRLAWFSPDAGAGRRSESAPPAHQVGTGDLPSAADLSIKGGEHHARTLTLSQDVDLNGDVNVDSILDRVRGPSGALRILVEQSRPTGNVEVDDRLNVHGHVNLNDVRQGQGPGRRQPGDAPEAGPPLCPTPLDSSGVAVLGTAQVVRPACPGDASCARGATRARARTAVTHDSAESRSDAMHVPDSAESPGDPMHAPGSAASQAAGPPARTAQEPGTARRAVHAEAPAGAIVPVLAAAPAPRGLLVVYSGQGKGKTTAALGIVFRALGRGMRVAVVQFIKGKWKTGERRFAETLPGLTFLVMGAGFTWNSDDLGRDRAAARGAWATARQLIERGDHAIVVIDEITYAINYGFIELADVLDTLRGRPPHVHVVATGRNAPVELCALADLVTEMTPIKHPFEHGIKAQPGIDY